MPIKTIEHNNKEVIYLDWRGIKETEILISELEQYSEKLLADKKQVVTLLDMKDAAIPKELLKLAKELGPVYEKYEDKVAVYGVTPMRKILMKSLNLAKMINLTPFNTKEEALEWLTK